MSSFATSGVPQTKEWPRAWAGSFRIILLLPSFEKQCAAAQDLVAALTSPGWWATAKVDQSRTLKDEAGNAIWENTTPFKYHDGWLSVYWTAYQ